MGQVVSSNLGELDFQISESITAGSRLEERGSPSPPALRTEQLALVYAPLLPGMLPHATNYSVLAAEQRRMNKTGCSFPTEESEFRGKTRVEVWTATRRDQSGRSKCLPKATRRVILHKKNALAKFRFEFRC